MGPGVGGTLGTGDGTIVGSGLGCGVGAIVGEGVGRNESVGTGVGSNVEVSAPSTVTPAARALEEFEAAVIASTSVPLVAAVLTADVTLAMGSAPLAFDEVVKVTS